MTDNTPWGEKNRPVSASEKAAERAADRRAAENQENAAYDAEGNRAAGVGYQSVDETEAERANTATAAERDRPDTASEAAARQVAAQVTLSETRDEAEARENADAEAQKRADAVQPNVNVDDNRSDN